MSRDRTPTEVMVTPLDLSSQGVEVLAWLRARAEVDRQHGIEVSMPSKLSDDGPWGVVKLANGDFYALCGEGVGPDAPIGMGNPLTVSWYVRGYEVGEGEPKADFIPLAPVASSTYDGPELQKLVEGGSALEPVNLADFIRTFGARLDANYESWRRRLEAALAPATA